MAETLRVLYVSYLSLEDPLVETQVVSYLEGLSERGHTVHLLTFDPALDAQTRRGIAERLKARGIEWHSLRYHKRPSLPATAFDTLNGAVLAARLIRRHRLDAIHARNQVPVAMALLAQRLTKCKIIFDVRGLMADEYADAGRWKRGGLPYRITQRFQRTGLRRADAVVILTEAVRRHLHKLGANGDSATVIPCCADLQQIELRAREREAAKEELGASARPVMVYLGKFTGWYLEREMADFYAVARALWPDLMFLIITQADPRPMLRELERVGTGSADYRVIRVAPRDIGRYLAAADFGISFIRPCFSKISSSPTKIGEYLSAGLPVVSSRHIGDVDALIAGNGVGVLVEDFSRPCYELAVRALQELVHNRGLAERCQKVAREQLSLQELGIPRYDQVYRRVAATTHTGKPRPRAIR
jgi:glycosyltransferase involved in cell wall biosynthesis